MTARKREPGKLHEDANEIAFRTVQAAIGEAEKPIPLSDVPKTRRTLRLRNPWKMEDLLELMKAEQADNSN